MYELEFSKVQAHNACKQHLVLDQTQKTLQEVSNSLVGIHSARLITPYSALISRIDQFTPKDLISETYHSHSLIKLRCMRKTLHTVSLELAPIVHQATKKMRLSIVRNMYSKHGTTSEYADKLKLATFEYIQNRELSSQSIEKYLKSCFKVDPYLSRVIIKDLWEQGEICYLNRSNYWGREKRRYALTREKYPSLNLESITEQAAKKQLVLKHISCYGPVTIKDTAWWSGLSIADIKESLQTLGGEVTKVAINGLDGVYYITKQDLRVVEKKESIAHINFLAYEDPFLKGYFESRCRYISKKFYYKLFNKIGEARASIIKNGRIIGVWAWNKHENNIDIEYFKKLSLSDRAHISSISKIIRLKLQEETNLNSINITCNSIK